MIENNKKLLDFIVIYNTNFANQFITNNLNIYKKYNIIVIRLNK